MQHVTHKSEVNPEKIMDSLVGMVEAKLGRSLTATEKTMLQNNACGLIVAQLLNKQHRLKIFTKTDCELCDRAKSFLASHPEIPYDEVVLDKQEMRNRMYDRFGLTGAARLMPQIVLIEDDGSEFHIGGWKDLEYAGLQSLFMNLKSS